MIKYRLIKEYPGSPKLETIASTIKSKNIDYFDFTPVFTPQGGYIDHTYIENNPEY